MTVKELYNFLGELIEKSEFIASMDVEIWNSFDKNAYNWNHTHSTHTFDKNDIHVEGWWDGETWDESSDSYDYLEIKIK